MKQLKWKYLLADNDNTLMDFTLAESRALRETLHALDLPETDDAVAVYHRMNDAQWKALERGETTLARLKVDRFRLFLDHFGITAVTPEVLCDAYENQLGTHAELLPGAMQLLEQAHNAGMKIALVSNGISRIQRGRLSVCEFTGLLDAVVISEEIGAAKPDPKMITIAMEMLGCGNKADAVMLGDSLTADIKAAANAGVTSIWLNRKDDTVSSSADCTVHSLEEACRVLLPEA